MFSTSPRLCQSVLSVRRSRAGLRPSILTRSVLACGCAPLRLPVDPLTESRAVLADRALVGALPLVPRATLPPPLIKPPQVVSDRQAHAIPSPQV